MNVPLVRYRTIFISDLHLGSAGCKAAAARSFLQNTECDHLFLVGDFFDGWVGRGAGKWSQECNEVVRTLLEKSKRGTEIYYTPGNHDAFMRTMNGSEIGNMLVEHAFIYRLLDGRELWVEHGEVRP